MRNTLLRRVAAWATTLGLASLGVLGAGAAPAQAARSDCPMGYLCVWGAQGYNGPMLKTKTSMATLGSWDNKIETVFNRTSSIACLYDEPNYARTTGYHWVDPDPDYATHYGDMLSTSSMKLVRTLRECETDAYPYWEAATAPKAGGFGDMNGDRRADIALRDEAGRLWFLPGDGTGRLIGSGGWNAFDALARHGDFSRDGREDVIAREKATGKLWLYPGTGSGGLGTRALIGSGGWNSMGRIAAFGDLTGDGRSDLFAVEKATGKLWLYPGTGSGLGARKLVGSGGWNSMNALVGAGDMTGDGRPDLIAREKATGKLWLYPGTSTWGLGGRTLIGNGGWNSMQHLLGIGDTSGDGRPDLHAADGIWLHQYQGTATGGLRKVASDNGDWWALEGAAAF
ncbi:FG-GAP-like repeat-containing protein [Streptomyces genisteinicus]|uniref:VCBS repeat-containing protein n=1 Tax=Streptomyces genisteinicus TaxID=2768068 RepID=A0A7H0HWH5_9ACTN|nr:FG-GAP-like repeat-containing protein [Streptomyces genisteinicus]QNP64891.1 VCBS repeat-containing protein [Streptomyces genisteinicus]